MTEQPLIPHAISREDGGLRIDWLEGRHQGFFPSRGLRLACPCAGCVEEMTGRRLLNPTAIPEDIRPLRVGLVGTYGLRVEWSDGHNTGIYTFTRLLDTCPCPACAARRAPGG